VKMLSKDDGPGYLDGSLYLEQPPPPSPLHSLDLTDSPLQPQHIAGRKHIVSFLGFFLTVQVRVMAKGTSTVLWNANLLNPDPHLGIGYGYISRPRFIITKSVKNVIVGKFFDKNRHTRSYMSF
jgi:hypothetical protein